MSKFGTSSSEDETEFVELEFVSKKKGKEISAARSVFDAVSPEEIEELREKLDSGYFQNYLSLTFWKSLHSNYGSFMGYAFGFLLILLLNYEWMLEEIADSTEGHSVAKTFVILFVIYSYSFITLGLEFVQLAFFIVESHFSKRFKGLQEGINSVLEPYRKLRKLRSSKYFFVPAVILWCLLTAAMGSALWKWFWWNHICKSYHDKTCRGSWLGQLVINYRDEACYDGTASSMMCERLVSYLPIMLFSIFFVFLGNVFMPLVNGWLASYYQVSENLEAAFEMLDRLDEKSIAQSEPDDVNNSGETLDKKCGFEERVPIQPFMKQEGYLRNFVTTGLGVGVLLLLDWMIVKYLFP